MYYQDLGYVCFREFWIKFLDAVLIGNWKEKFPPVEPIPAFDETNWDRQCRALRQHHDKPDIAWRAYYDAQPYADDYSTDEDVENGPVVLNNPPAFNRFLPMHEVNNIIMYYYYYYRT